MDGYQLPWEHITAASQTLRECIPGSTVVRTPKLINLK